MTSIDAFDQRQLRGVLGTFPTGVTVVTTRDAAGVAHGVTANSFSSVSLDPPLVLWSQSLTSKSYPAFRDSEHFAVNILADDQVSVSNHFAKSREDKFSGIGHSVGVGGSPVLDGAAAHLECVKVATYPGGDHVVYLGRVERIGHSSRRPLAFALGRYVIPYAHDLGPTSQLLRSAKSASAEAVRLASDTLPVISREVGDHTLCLAVWGNHGPTAIRWELGLIPVSEHPRAGLVMSITRSATGHSFAAFLPEDVTRAYIEEDLHLFREPDEDAATQRRTFEEHIGETRRRGLSRAVGAEPSRLHQVPVNAFSAPIFDADGSMVMALSLTAQAHRLANDWDGPAPKALTHAAVELSRQLGWTGAIPTNRTEEAAA